MSSQNITKLDLTYGPTIWKFMEDNSFFRIVIGPVGSGKSTGVGCGELMRRALMQAPSPIDNYRYVKALIVRNTAPDLRRTTVHTWQAMYPPTIGKFNETRLVHHIVMPPTNEQPGLNFLVEFIGLDKPDDMKKLHSWEGTIIWFNEMKEIDRNIIDHASSRVGRFPSLKQGGVMPSWYGMIGDTNSYSPGHWMEALESDPPTDWKFFRQPPAVFEMEITPDGWGSLEPAYPYTTSDPDHIFHEAKTLWAVNPKAENLPYLPIKPDVNPTLDPLRRGAYYPVVLSGKSRSYIEMYLQGKNTRVELNKRVIPEFDQTTMVTSVDNYNPNLNLYCGLDFGAGTLNPAAVFGQLDVIYNRWYILRELVCQGMGLLQFADQLLLTIQQYFYARSDVLFYGDPAGLIQDGIEQKTYYDHLATKGIFAFPAPTNAVTVRIECIKAPMLRYSQGKPGIIVSRECPTLIDGLMGKWYYKRLNVMNEERFDDKPSKNHPHSDVCEALGYLLSAGGEHFSMVVGQKRAEIRCHVGDTTWDPIK